LRSGDEEIGQLVGGRLAATALALLGEEVRRPY